MKKKKKLWIVSELYYPELTSTGYIVTQIAEDLSKDYDINVLCAQPTYSARGMHAPKHEKRNGVKIRRCFSTTLNKDFIVFKLINFITLSITLFANALLRLKKGDIVLVVTNPPLLPFFIAVACNVRRSKCCLLIHDIYPDLLIATGMMDRKSLFFKILTRSTRILYRSVCYVFVIGRDMKEVVLKKNNNCCDKIVVATNWADLDLVKPASREKNVLIQSLGISNKFIVLHAGNMGYPNDIETILSAADLLRENEDVVFLFIGSGARKKMIEDYVLNNKLKNIIILSNKPRCEQSDFLNACDIAIITLKKNMSGLSVPSRIYNTLASGKPIIAVADRSSELSIVVEEEKIGWTVTPGHSIEIVNAIKMAMMDNDRLYEMGKRSRVAAEMKYSFQNVICIYRNTFKNL